MTNAWILSHIDHTNLKTDAKWDDIVQLCEEALQYHMASVCIPSCWVKRAKTAFPALNVCTVIGFPLGYQPAAVKVFEAQQAIADGATEIDMVINVSALKSGDTDSVLQEICAVREVCRGILLKVIVETCYLTEQEKITCCELVSKAGADYIKTSTGFGTAGANLDDIALFHKHIDKVMNIKAAGGIRTREEMEAYLKAGCARIGSSAARILFDGV